MYYLFTTLWVQIPFFIFLFYILLYLYMSRNNNYWKKRGIPYLKPSQFFGSIGKVFKFQLSIGEVFEEAYQSCKGPFLGMFICDEPVLLVRDLELVKCILVKNFEHFIDRTMTDNVEDDPMGSHILFVMKNPDWKEIRRKITPVFTSGKMKMMYKLILECGDDLVLHINKLLEQTDVIETREVCSKYTTESITSTSFGIRANCFTNEDSEFRAASRRIFNWNIWSRGVACTCYFIAPTLVKLFHMKFVDSASATFLRKAFWTTMSEREESKMVRNDLLDILIQMKNDEHIDDPYKLEGDKLVAQATQFFIAGYETSSSTISFALYELAKNPVLQDKLREEIVAVMEKHSGKLSYDCVKEMTYLDQCVAETLRMYPVLAFLDRRCHKDFNIPGTDVTIEKGTAVFISNRGIHFDPEFYPNPDQFDPSRFTDENKATRPTFAYLPFGEGPRNCIGARFGLLSSKSGLIQIIKNFKVSVCDETQKVMKFDPKGFLLAPVKGLSLRFRKVV